MPCEVRSRACTFLLWVRIRPPYSQGTGTPLGVLPCNTHTPGYVLMPNNAQKQAKMINELLRQFPFHCNKAKN